MLTPATLYKRRKSKIWIGTAGWAKPYQGKEPPCADDIYCLIRTAWRLGYSRYESAEAYDSMRYLDLFDLHTFILTKDADNHNADMYHSWSPGDPIIESCAASVYVPEMRAAERSGMIRVSVDYSIFNDYALRVKTKMILDARSVRQHNITSKMGHEGSRLADLSTLMALDGGRFERVTIGINSAKELRALDKLIRSCPALTSDGIKELHNIHRMPYKKLDPRVVK